jgi:hypothetical protein
MDKKAKITILFYIIGTVLITLILAIRLSYMGRPLPDVLQSTGILFIFLLMPIVGVIRSLKLKALGRTPKRSGLRITVLFLAPILVALVYYATYPSGVAMPLAVAVLAGALLFVYLSQ